MRQPDHATGLQQRCTPRAEAPRGATSNRTGTPARGRSPPGSKYETRPSKSKAPGVKRTPNKTSQAQPACVAPLCPQNAYSYLLSYALCSV